MGELLRRSAVESPVVKKGDYDYFVHPLTDGVPRIEPALLKEVVDEILAIAERRVDLILTAEAMGIPLATALSERTGIPFAIVRKRSYGLEGEVAVHQTTGYSANQLYLNGVRAGDRVLFVDDVVSTGGTLGAIIEAVQRTGARIADIVVVFEKGAGRARIEERYNVKVKTLLRVDVRDGRVALV
ncbi:MAG TPA: hypoxanthine/guanine phosphoribosyltransferase [Candidatus Thermoplasmatota archaeon]|jgi:adenine phosphoribosyltransferase|nr:hypoxanthine/guanine phosphoribosyltransferase [Candidatus Thermoplasmatota archaeon]